MEHRAVDDYMKRLDALLGEVVGGRGLGRLVPFPVPVPSRRRPRLYPYGVFDRRAARGYFARPW